MRARPRDAQLGKTVVAPAPDVTAWHQRARRVEPRGHRLFVEPLQLLSDGGGVVRTAPNLHHDEWRGYDLAAALHERFGYPARVGNDADYHFADPIRLRYKRKADDTEFHDFSAGYTSLEQETQEVAPPRVGWFRRWLAKQRAWRLERELETAAAEEARVDEILAQLHEHGIESLSKEDRALLERVSARYRNRHE